MNSVWILKGKTVCKKSKESTSNEVYEVLYAERREALSLTFYWVYKSTPTKRGRHKYEKSYHKGNEY